MTMGMRDVARLAARGEITAAAMIRFGSQGFQETTIDQISADVGMSSRTFFRYFPSKDEVVLQLSHAWRSRFLEGLTASLPSNDLWSTLEETLASTACWCEGHALGGYGQAMQILIRDTPVLLARQLELMEGAQSEAARACLGAVDKNTSLTVPVVHAVIGSAFACYNSVRHHHGDGEDAAGMAIRLRTLMEVLRPRVLINDAACA